MFPPLKKSVKRTPPSTEEEEEKRKLKGVLLEYHTTTGFQRGHLTTHTHTQ